MKKKTDDLPIGLNASISIGEGLSVDCYAVAGAFRYGLAQASELLGYEKTYLSQVVLKEQQKLKDLQGIGFTGCLLPIKVGRARPKTLSFDDFCILVEFEAVKVENPKAIALLTSAFREVLRGRTQSAFGLDEDDEETKQADFAASFYEREAVWAENRADVEGLVLAGDEDRNIAEYDPAFARFENDTLYAKYSSYYPEYFDEAA